MPIFISITGLHEPLECSQFGGGVPNPQHRTGDYQAPSLKYYNCYSVLPPSNLPLSTSLNYPPIYPPVTHLKPPYASPTGPSPLHPTTVITISRIWRDRFLLTNSRYLRCRCSVTCFNLDKLQEVRPLGVVVFKIRSYTRVSGHTVYDQVV